VSEARRSVAALIMPFRTVLVTRHWTLERPGHRARITCDVALVQGGGDEGLYELRVSLNDELAYARVWETHEAVTADAERTLHELLNGGWCPVDTGDECGTA